MPRLTHRGWLVLIAAGVLFGAGEWLGYPMFRALAGAALGAVLAALVSTVRRPRLTVTRDVYPDRVQRDRPAFARLRVHNSGTGRHGGFTAGDRVAGGFHAVAVRPLAPGAEAVYHYDLPTARRGRFQVGPLTLERVDPLELSRSRLTTGDTTTLWVHPRTYPVRVVVGGHPRHHHEGRTTNESPHGSLDQQDVREYVIGDEVRHLHWKATARTGSLMIVDYADPNQPRFTALLDTRPVDPVVFEHAVDLTASLLTAAATAGHRCRLVTPGGLDVVQRGGTQAVRRFLDELAELDVTAGESLVPASLARSGDRGGSLVVIMAGGEQPDLAALASIRQHYVTTVVFSLAGPAFQVPGAQVLSATTAAGAVRSWNQAVLG